MGFFCMNNEPDRMCDLCTLGMIVIVDTYQRACVCVCVCVYVGVSMLSFVTDRGVFVVQKI